MRCNAPRRILHRAGNALGKVLPHQEPHAKVLFMLQELINAFVLDIAAHLPRPDAIASAAKRLSFAFTSERRAISKDYLANAEHLDAYAAAFLLPNAAKVLHGLQQIDAGGLIPADGPLKVLDLGAGPGTAILAASSYLAHTRPGREVRFVAIEQNQGALTMAHALFKHVAPPEHVFESAALDLSSASLRSLLGVSTFDIVIAANLLNEMDEEKAFQLCEELVSTLLCAKGCLLIIDPALRETTRPLMRLRNRLLKSGASRVVAPCLHQQRCPMLAAHERDWCHFYIDWDRPDYLRKLDTLSGMDHTHLKMAYFILAQQPGAVASSASGLAKLWRVVSSPLISKGKKELVLCGEEGCLMKLRRLDRDASEENRALDDVVRGDVVQCTSEVRLGANSSFAVHVPWNDLRRIPEIAR
jgi:ribosomal protein RSM22 (predicted rRNA methylase)